MLRVAYWGILIMEHLYLGTPRNHIDKCSSFEMAQLVLGLGLRVLGCVLGAGANTLEALKNSKQSHSCCPLNPSLAKTNPARMTAIGRPCTRRCSQSSDGLGNMSPPLILEASLPPKPPHFP